MKLALIGYGKMGKTIEQTALQRGHQIVCIIDADNQHDFRSPQFAQADAAIEFTTPTAAIDNYRRAWQIGIPVVSGTTGWTAQLPDIQHEIATNGYTLFWSSNFSLGVNIFMELNRHLAKLMNAFPNYAPSMTEIHHTEKKDAPSGTAITLAEELAAEVERVSGWQLGMLTNPDGSQEGTEEVAPGKMRIDSIRRGEVPGIHSITWDSPADSITITHDAHNRRGFALGAVLAAEYTARHNGLLTMSDLFKF